MGPLIHPINCPLLSFPSEKKATEDVEEVPPSLSKEADLNSARRKDASHRPFLTECN